MPLLIYNSLTRKKEEFIPLSVGEVKMYVCGPTVYDQPHIGHIRSAYIFDFITRYLSYRGYKVALVRNVTDVDDKIIQKARDEFPAQDLNLAVEKVAEKYLSLYHQALAELEIDREDLKIKRYQPRASEYIQKMVDFIRRLIEKGAAYQAGGDVYFDITRAKDYGKLSGQAPDKMEAGARVSPLENKKNPLDFALWKSAKENEPSWASPWGRGRPGWHIECSVMSSDILGDEFDIHAGGMDLLFPHHENEIAQAEALGGGFARYWMHHGLLTINAQKMAKSLGNFLTVSDFMAKYKNADILKLFFLSSHYSHPVDYSDEKIQEARQALERIMIFLEKISRNMTEYQSIRVSEYQIEEIKQKFIAAMDDDFNTPQALAAIFELISAANRNISDANFMLQAGDAIKELLGILGLSLEAKDSGGISDKEIKAKISEREKARQEKNFARADQIRKSLEAEGIILEDQKGGTIWRRKL